jgi:hypothetical protein
MNKPYNLHLWHYLFRATVIHQKTIRQKTIHQKTIHQTTIRQTTIRQRTIHQMGQSIKWGNPSNAALVPRGLNQGSTFITLVPTVGDERTVLSPLVRLG